MIQPTEEFEEEHNLRVMGKILKKNASILTKNYQKHLNIMCNLEGSTTFDSFLFIYKFICRHHSPRIRIKCCFSS